VIDKFVFCFDLDQTLCQTEGTDYANSLPRLERIQRVNQLYCDGHTILIFTARGSKNGIDYFALTEKQLTDWQILYHKLLLGKPFADFYIDDKGINSELFDWEIPL
jgi:prepilin-type processing-associated H-X9-DG protein